MKLNLEQMRTVTQGAVYLEQRETGVRFHRFNPEEEKVYEGSSLYPKVFAPAGIRMDFETDAEQLQMTVDAYCVTSRSYFRFDILVDGQLLGDIRNYPEGVENGTYPAGKYPLGIYSGDFSLGAGNKRLTIQFPWSVPCEIQNLELVGATYIKPLPRAQKALLYGDSITQGYDALSPSRSYAVQLCDWLGVEGFNKAIGGEVYCPKLAEVATGIDPAYVFVAYGVNDWHRLTQPDFEDRCRRFWQTVCSRYPEAKKFMLTPVWFIPNRATEFGPFEDVERILRKVHGEFPEVTLIYGWDLVPHDPALYGDGRLHPNTEGFEHYTKNLTKALAPFVGK